MDSVVLADFRRQRLLYALLGNSAVLIYAYAFSQSAYIEGAFEGLFVLFSLALLLLYWKGKNRMRSSC